MTSHERTGILLVNTGTTAAPTVSDTRAYLKEFLSDPRVVDMPAALRWLLLRLVILPRRSKHSAAAYRGIWTDDGSPLLAHSRALRDALRHRIAGAAVEIGMRYGSPSMADGLDLLREAGVDRVVIAPLFPQYASATVGSTLERAYALAGAPWNVLPLAVLPPFYAEQEFLDAWAAVARPVVNEFAPDHVLMSFHGLPERHIRKSDPTGEHCLQRPDCCRRIGPENRFCYRAQCLATARLLAGRLGLDDARYTVSFQSRLGRDPWLGPATSAVLPELPGRGARRLAVLCPSFTADCLETLEEIGMRGRDLFIGAGGEDFRLVPSLNAHSAWVEGLARLLSRL